MLPFSRAFSDIERPFCPKVCVMELKKKIFELFACHLKKIGKG
jgi:hypothetical protein